MLMIGVCLLHDNDRPHVANATKACLNSFSWQILNHPAYFIDLMPSDFYLFIFLKTHMTRKKFLTDEEVKRKVLL